MKLYKLTAKQNGKRRTRARYTNFNHNAPASYRRPYIKITKGQCRQILRESIAAWNFDLPYPLWKKTATYDYW